MTVKRRRRRKKRQIGRGKLEKFALKAASGFIPGLAKGKKGNPKVTTEAKIKLGIDLAIAAVKGPISFVTTLLLNAQKIGTLLGTNYENPGNQKDYERIQDKSFKQFRRSGGGAGQYGWGYLMGSPIGHKRRRTVVLTPHQKAHQKAWHSKKHM